MEIDYGDKLGFMHLGRGGPDSKEALELPTGEVRHAQTQVKLLGIILDTEMRFGPHLKAMKAKAQGALALTQRLGGHIYGVKGDAVRMVYKACVLSIMEYGIEIWYHKLGRSRLEGLQKIQNQALRLILGAAYTTPLSALHAEGALAPLHIKWHAMIQRKTIRHQYRLNLDNAVPGLAAKEGTALEFNKRLLPPGIPWKVRRAKDTAFAPWTKEEERSVDPEAIADNAELRQEMRQSLEVIEKQNAESFQEWYDNYKTRSRDNPTEEARPSCPHYRAINPKLTVSIKLPDTILCKAMRTASRQVLSLLVQLRTNHLGRFGVPPPCKCGSDITVSHILRECHLREQARVALAAEAGALTDANLLGTEDGLLAVTAFLSNPLEF
ncbi:putative RNA-directed DNA polymerase from transposon BS [Yarrowia sp. C11]|nr:putative RNA-directed DNA polymerase from transposon BS [Yarrowia sp. C11]